MGRAGTDGKERLKMNQPSRIILIRHGQTTSNVDRLIDTRPPGAELTDLGRQQARDLGHELAEYCGVGDGHFGRIAKVYSSIAIRAQQTAMHLTASLGQAAGLDARAMPVETVMGIHETAAGDCEMRGDEEAHRTYAYALAGWMTGDKQARTPGENGEGIDDILGRYQPVLENIVASDLSGDQPQDVLVVSHGAAIRLVSRHATGVDPEFAFAGYLPNCRFIVLEPSGQEFGRWKLVRWADLQHQI